jgi:hypothetical protein
MSSFFCPFLGGEACRDTRRALKPTGCPDPTRRAARFSALFFGGKIQKG